MLKEQKEKFRVPKSPILHDVAGLKIIQEKDFLRDLSCERALLENIQIPGLKAHGVLIDSSRIKNVDFSNSTLRGLRLGDVLAEKINMANADLEESGWDRIVISGSRLTGFKFVSSRGRDLVFKNCKIDLSTFRFSKMKDIRFESCVLTDADFFGAELENVTFSGSDITNVDFSQAKMKNVDICGSKIEGIKIASEQLKALIIDYSQAVYVIQLLGITIK